MAQGERSAEKAPAKDAGVFKFCSRLNLTLLTGRRARDLAQMVENLRTVPGSVIYHHTHHYLEQHQHLSPEPPNDFAYWTTNVLLEQRLGEELAAIDVLRFSTIHDLRDALVETIQRFLDSADNVRVAPPGQEFHFMRSVSFVLPTDVRASNLKEFGEALKHVSLGSIAYHMFDARLRLDLADNDFSRWLETTLGERELAEALRNVDPYTHTEEGLRQRMIALVNRRLEQRDGRSA
ncbi:MAG TPA: DUF5752 family protein [Candidatus Binataceae bacterium]|nr:DUF5752 family protein [Candidatus Binataceae bacterium]